MVLATCPSLSLEVCVLDLKGFVHDALGAGSLEEGKRIKWHSSFSLLAN